MEVWKDIPNYSGYQASNLGRIRTHNKTTYTEKHGVRHWKDRILQYKKEEYSKKENKQGIGYRVDLWKDGKPHTLLVHRLVATTFLENLIDSSMTVNHKDGNRYNNNIENLEWLTLKDNIKYGIENNQYPSKAIKLKNIKTKQIYSFKSYADASRFLHRNKSYVSNCIIKNQKIKNKEREIYIITNEKVCSKQRDL